MDPSLDPPPVAAQTAVASPAVAAAVTAVAAAVNATPVQLAVHNHPPYAEMISAAITALNEREGSSKRAIAKYIETHYSDLPPTHSALLTHHLKRLKSIGQLLMVKHSYTLPGLRSEPTAVNGTVNVESADPASTVTKRRPGRPPKPKPDAVQVAVPVFPPPPINMNDVPNLPPELPANLAPLPENSHIAAAPVNGAATATPVRGRGRPPKQSGVKRGRGRPPKSGGGGSGIGRGRPKKNSAPAAAPAAAVRREGSGRPRGRPPKPINVVEGPLKPVEGFAPLSDAIAAAPVVAPPVVSPVTGKRRGRPRKSENEAKKPRNMPAVVPMKARNLSGRPRGRPRKNGAAAAAAAAAARTQDSQLLVAYLDLKAKLENLQSMVKHTATFIRPSLNSEAAINAIQELELVAMNVSAPTIVQPQQQPVPEQAQPQS